MHTIPLEIFVSTLMNLRKQKNRSKQLIRSLQNIHFLSKKELPWQALLV